MKNKYIGRDCLKRGTWTVCKFKGGGLARKKGWCFFGGGGGREEVDTSMHTMKENSNGEWEEITGLKKKSKEEGSCSN